MNNDLQESGESLARLLDQMGAAAAAVATVITPPAAGATTAQTATGFVLAGLTLLDLLTGLRTSAVAGAGLNLIDLIRVEDAVILKPTA